MTPELIGAVGLTAFFVLLVFRVPIAMAMMITGFAGIAAINGFPAACTILGSETFEIASYIELSVIPLFVLMGNLAGLSGMSRDLYNAAYAWADVIAIACVFAIVGNDVNGLIVPVGGRKPV